MKRATKARRASDATWMTDPLSRATYAAVAYPGSEALPLWSLEAEALVPAPVAIASHMLSRARALALAYQTRQAKWENDPTPETSDSLLETKDALARFIHELETLRALQRHPE